MKKLIIFIFFTSNLIGQLKPNSVIDLNNFDKVYAEKLLTEKFNKELAKLLPDMKPIKMDSAGYKPLEYQLSLSKETGTEISHRNTFKFRNVFLEHVGDRFFHFNKKKDRFTIIEVLTRFTYDYEIRKETQYYTKDSSNYKEHRMCSFIKTEKLNDNRVYYTYDSNTNTYTSVSNNILYNDSFTYEKIVLKIYENFMIHSEAHRTFIILSYELGLNYFWKIEFENKSNSLTIWSGALFFE